MANFEKSIYEQEKSALKITVCDECRQEFIMTANRILQTELDAKGEHIVLTYFLCPHCGKLYKISIDSIKTMQLKQLVETHANKLAAYKSRGKTITPAQIERVNKYRKLLTKEYARLDSIYTGSFYQKSEQDNTQSGN